MKTLFSVVFCTAVMAAGLTGCKSSSDPGVSTDYHSSWTNVNASTAATADASKSVLTDMGLTGVSSSSTAVDGVAEGTKADGTVVHVKINQEGTGSKLSVTVGTIGDPKLGSDIADKIKAKAEMK